MTTTQTTNDKPHKGYFSGARLLALVLVGAAMTILAPGGEHAAADDARINNAAIGDDVAADSLRFRSLAHGGGTFADMHQTMQLRVLSQWQDAIAQKAEGAIMEEFSAVKKADIYLQTNIGARKGHLGAHIIGALADTGDKAFGWQVRAYAAEDNTKGANAGLFARSVKGGFLFGGNIFADYEDGEFGDFVRYGAGAEMANKFYAFNANFYIPSTSEKTTSEFIAFSRKGYDANLRMNIPDVAFAKLRADYYHFDADHGAEKDSGFRYGMEFHPLAGLRFGVFFDEGGDDVGGDIAYSYTIGESPARHNSANDFFAPDLFAPVSREYSQRIATVAAPVTVTLVDVQVMITPERTRFEPVLATSTDASLARFHATIDYSVDSFRWIWLTRNRVEGVLPLNITHPYPTVFQQEDNIAAITLETIQSNHTNITVGHIGRPVANSQAPFTATIVAGSEEYIAPIIMTTGTSTITTVPMMTITTTTTTTITTTADTASLSPQQPPNDAPATPVNIKTAINGINAINGKKANFAADNATPPSPPPFSRRQNKAGIHPPAIPA